MNVAMINCGLIGSTGKIMLQIADSATKNGHKVCLVVSGLPVNKTVKTEHRVLFIGNEITRKINVALGRITGFNGCFAYFATKKMLKQLDKFSPDLIHLHNLHESYINLPLLFKYIKKNNIKVVWTLHDCWAFTGHCSYFTISDCQKWKTQCEKCISRKEYPKSYIDNSKYAFNLKKKWFLGVENLNIVTPSKWLANLVGQSFLKHYPINVINNGIDLSVFKPTENKFRGKYNIPDEKFIILCVAFGWGERKGLDVVCSLSARLDINKYQIVIVGTDSKVDKILPPNIISIHRTNNQKELAEIYTASDVFFNPTREEVLGLVNIEANACGTPVVTFDTDGSPECISADSGIVIEKDNVDSAVNEIIKICDDNPFGKEACIDNARLFDKNILFKRYVELFENI